MAQAQKKPAHDQFAFAEPVQPVRRSPKNVESAGAATAFSDAIRHPGTWRPSPAKDLQDMLSQWAEEVTNPDAAASAAQNASISMQARLAFIISASLFLWAIVAFAAYQI